jgi:hypothetical protein
MCDQGGRTVSGLRAVFSRILKPSPHTTWQWQLTTLVRQSVPAPGRFPPSLLGDQNGWPGEQWLDIRNLSVLGPIMQARFSLCRSRGFDLSMRKTLDLGPGRQVCW